MNRQERRAAEKKGAKTTASKTAIPMMPVVGAGERPSLVLRAMGSLLLAGWVLKRVHHPQVLLILADLARQVQRMDALVQIQTRLQDPQS